METARVIYVDDEPELLEVTKAFLEMEGDIVVDTEESSRAAIDRLAAGDYDVLVSDYQIPRMNGIELLKALRVRGDRTPFILFTGRGREEIAIEALNNGADFYLQKGGDPTVQFGELRHAVLHLAERGRIQERLVESERKLSTLMANLPGMAYRCKNDEDWTMEFVSAGCRKLTGHPPEDLLNNGKVSYASLIVPEHRAPVWTAVQAGVEGQRPYEMTYAIRTPQGEVKWVWEQGEAVLDAAGKPIALEGFITDITEHKMTEEKLRQANAKMDLLASTTRHDIGNRLLVIDGYLYLLKAKLQAPDELDLAEKIESALRYIHAYIHFTKDYGVMGSTAPTWQRAAGIISFLPIAQEAGRVLVSDRVQGLEVLADPMLPKVFHNLIEDSLRYGGRPVTIRLDCYREGERLVLVYEDDGMGIPFEDKERIFNKGFGKGTGLGLFLARNILDITGITIRETGRPGQGARFEMSVPPAHFCFRE